MCYYCITIIIVRCRGRKRMMFLCFKKGNFSSLSHLPIRLKIAIKIVIIAHEKSKSFYSSTVIGRYSRKKLFLYLSFFLDISLTNAQSLPSPQFAQPYSEAPFEFNFSFLVLLLSLLLSLSFYIFIYICRFQIYKL